MEVQTATFARRETMPTTDSQLEKSDPPSAHPSTTVEPTRPEEERPDTDGDRRVGDIDDLPRPEWNIAPE
jgi:hypothetical protein